MPLRLLGLAAAATAAVWLTALPAWAHVTVSSPGATQGGFGVLTFRMPNESDVANATQLKVQLPANQPLASLAVRPQAGWSYMVKRAKLATPITDDDGNRVTEYPSEVDWTATAGGIKPGEYADFDLSVGPFPKASSMVFKAVQVYSDGSTVSWIEQAAAGSTDKPEHPAPTLQLTAVGPTSASAAKPDSTLPAATSGGDTGKGSVVGAYIVGGFGLLAGAAALALAASGWRRRRSADASRSASPSGGDEQTVAAPKT